MNKKILRILRRRIKTRASIFIIALFLLIVFVGNIINLVATVKLRRQTELILNEIIASQEKVFLQEDEQVFYEDPVVLVDSGGKKVIVSQGKMIKASTSKEVLEIDEAVFSDQEEVVGSSQNDQVIEPLVRPNNSEVIVEKSSDDYKEKYSKIYNNMALDYFINDLFFDKSKTDMHWDESVTALTFPPLYDISYEGACSTPSCDLVLSNTGSCLNGKCASVKEKAVYYEGLEQTYPKEIRDREVKAIFVHPLKTKWLVSFLINDNNQEAVYLYYLNSQGLSGLINSPDILPIKTNYGRGGGSVAAAGSDDQFMVFYSGYEGLGYLYNNGAWQNLSPYIGLRVVNRGFPSQIVKSGSGKGATWYICSTDPKNSRFLKLWQNGTDQIQGIINLKSVLPEEAAGCVLKNDKEVLVANQSGRYVFKDRGFDNSKDFTYQSINFNSFSGKKIINARLQNYFLNADRNIYKLEFSNDNLAWENASSGPVDFTVMGGELYFRGKFLARDADYSPCFFDLKSIYYQAVD